MSTAPAQLPDYSTLNGRVVRNVRHLKDDFRLNQTQLAAVIDITQTQMSRRLHGAVPFSLEEVERLADYFGVTAGALLGYEEMPLNPRGPRGIGGVARPEGFEPPTFWLGVDHDAEVIQLMPRRQLHIEGIVA